MTMPAPKLTAIQGNSWILAASAAIVRRSHSKTRRIRSDVSPNDGCAWPAAAPCGHHVVVRARPLPSSATTYSAKDSTTQNQNDATQQPKRKSAARNLFRKRITQADGAVEHR